MISKKSRIAAAILAFFLGGFGIHKHLLNVLFISAEAKKHLIKNIMIITTNSNQKPEWDIPLIGFFSIKRFLFFALNPFLSCSVKMV
ncbi:hypothetical protein SRCM100169_03345 [Bacillus siamensis]|nr:hypothetical protein SRCM100169_03345 [Bacillus siamensis]